MPTNGSQNVASLPVVYPDSAEKRPRQTRNRPDKLRGDTVTRRRQHEINRSHASEV